MAEKGSWKNQWQGQKKWRNLMEEQYFALLIDADNVSAKYITPILTELSKYGVITYKRIYGDWTSTLNASWKQELLTNSITPIQQFSYTTGKNATDSAMIIDAMDILYTNDVNGFCIVSSDSDFTRLVSRLRESGKMVIGMGENKTPEPFRKACDKFTILENLLVENDPGTAQEKEPEDGLSREAIEDEIIRIVLENQDSNKATGLGEVGSRLVSLYPDFDVRNYGYSLLSRFLQESGLFLLDKRDNVITISLKENEQSKEEIRTYVMEIIHKAGSKGIGINELSNRVHGRYSHFNVKDFGYSQFSKFVQGMEGVQVYADKNDRKRVKAL